MAGQGQDRWHLLDRELGEDSRPRVVDVGANPLDDPPYKPMLDAGLLHVHGFEPQKDAFEALQAAKTPQETYDNCAIGDGGTHALNIYRSSGLTSFFTLDPASQRFLGRSDRGAQLLATEELATRRLDDLDSIGRIDLLKIDVQGAETMIFTHATDRLSRAVAVITELRMYPLYRDEPMQDAQIAALADLGLRFHKYLFVKNQMIANSQGARLRSRRLGSQALDADGVFVRDLRQTDAIDDTQLGALARLADGVFGSFDLALHCLDLLVARGRVAEDLPRRYADLLPPDLLK